MFGTHLQVCLFFHCFLLIPQVNAGLTYCSQRMLFSCSTSCFQPSLLSALRLGDVFHCLSESHINTTSSAVAIGGREAAHTANNYIFPLSLLSSPRKSYSSPCQIFSHLTGGCADAGPGYPTLSFTVEGAKVTWFSFQRVIPLARGGGVLQYFHSYLFYHLVNHEKLNSEDAGGGETEFSRVTSMDVGKKVTSRVG